MAQICRATSTSSSGSSVVGLIGSTPPASTSKRFQEAIGRAYSLVQAVKAGDLGLVKRLVVDQTLVNCQDREGTTLLMLAASLGHAKIVELLLRSGADPRPQNHEGKTALFFAQQSRSFETSKALFNYQDAYGVTVLMRAAAFESALAVRVLLRAGADPKLCDHAGLDALAHAERAGNRDTVRMLLGYRLYAHLAKEPGKTLLMLAAQVGHVPALERLLKNNAAVAEVDARGRTALSYAVLGNRATVIDLLLAAKADPHQRFSNKRGTTVLVEATTRGHRLVAERLLAHGARVY